jgi:hypothetical protein
VTPRDRLLIRLTTLRHGRVVHELGLAAWLATPPGLVVGVVLELIAGDAVVGVLAPRSGLVATPVLLGWLLVLGLRARRPPMDLEAVVAAIHRNDRPCKAPRHRLVGPFPGSTTRSRRRARRAAARAVCGLILQGLPDVRRSWPGGSSRRPAPWTPSWARASSSR